MTIKNWDQIIRCRSQISLIIFLKFKGSLKNLYMEKSRQNSLQLQRHSGGKWGGADQMFAISFYYRPEGDSHCIYLKL